MFSENILACFRGPAFGSSRFGPRFEAPGPRYCPSLSYMSSAVSKWFLLLISLYWDLVQCNMHNSRVVVYRPPSNFADPMGDRIHPPSAWRAMHPPNMGPSANAGFHGMGPPLLPRSGDMAWPMDAVCINFIIPQSSLHI